MIIDSILLRWILFSFLKNGFVLVHSFPTQPSLFNVSTNATSQASFDLPLANVFVQLLISKYRTAVRAVTLPVPTDIQSDLWLITSDNEKLQWKNYTVVEEQKLVPAMVSKSQSDTVIKRRSIQGEAAIRPFQADLSTEEVKNLVSPVMSEMSLEGTATNKFRPPPVTGVVKNVTHVLMTTLIAAGNVFKTHANGTISLKLNRDLWLTAYPQVQDFCSSTASMDDIMKELNAHNTSSDGFLKTVSDQINSQLMLIPNTTGYQQRTISSRPSNDSLSWRTIRLLQYLGLPPVFPTNRIWFVSLWVNPKDLIRPCPNPDISMSSCTPTYVTKNDDGRFTIRPLPSNMTNSWFASMATQSGMFDYLSNDWTSIYPWTRLGYTMDWSGKRFGPTEFVVRRGAQVRVESVTTISQYCK